MSEWSRLVPPLVHARRMDGPSPRVLAAFRVSAPPELLPGGRGSTWRAGHTILKPVDDIGEASEVADIISRLKEDARYRVARPIRADDGRWIVGGWSAWTRLEGEPRVDRWPELLAAAAAFHDALQ